VNENAPPIEDALKPGVWKLLSTENELLLALRDHGDGLMTDLTELNPRAAVLAGDMSEMQPSDLLNFLHQGRRTGVLLTRSDGTERGIVLIDGNVAWAISTSPGERLGELMVRMGLVEHARVDEALKGQRESDKRLGQILIDAGIVSADAVARGLRHQVNEIFLGLLVARSGNFVFLRGIDRERLPSILELDTQAMLLDGLRRLDEMELYRTRVASSDLAPRPGKPPRHPDDLSADEAQVLSLADGRRTVADIAMATALGDFETTKAVYKLVEAGLLEM
jgi:hypothetical protein